jgi:hypothetical protein
MQWCFDCYIRRLIIETSTLSIYCYFLCLVITEVRSNQLTVFAVSFQKSQLTVYLSISFPFDRIINYYFCFVFTFSLSISEEFLFWSEGLLNFQIIFQWKIIFQLFYDCDYYYDDDDFFIIKRHELFEYEEKVSYTEYGMKSLSI